MAGLRIIACGQVRFAFVPFNDHKPSKGESVTQGKTRPVVILGWNSMSKEAVSSVLVAPIFTHGGSQYSRQAGGIAIDNTHELNLDQSWVQPFRIVAVHPNSLDLSEPARGKVSQAVMDEILKSISSMFADMGSYAPIPNR